MMNFKENQKGFIFSLDGTLALLVTLVALVGIAQVGSPLTHYKQHGFLQLERHANDGSRVLKLSGALRESVQLAKNQEKKKARELLRNNLRSSLPNEIQFKAVIGSGKSVLLDNVYPSSDNQAWSDALENADELTVSTNMIVENGEAIPVKLYVWRGENVA